MDRLSIQGMIKSPNVRRHVKDLGRELLNAWEREDQLLVEIARLNEPQEGGILLLVYPDGYAEVRGTPQPSKTLELPFEGSEDATPWLSGKWLELYQTKMLTNGNVDRTPMSDRISRACACGIADGLVDWGEDNV